MLLILTGRIHSGKTTRLRELVSEWRARGIALDGFLSPAVFESGRRVGYDWLDLGTDRCAPFLRRRGEAVWERVGPYFFIPPTLEKAKRKIRTHDRRNLLIVDEIGPLEIRGGGVWPALAGALSGPPLRCLLVVREEILDRFRRVAPVRPERVFTIEESGFSLELAGAVQTSSGT
jgi:nucleoside-triphosphatase THEP1